MYLCVGAYMCAYLYTILVSWSHNVFDINFCSYLDQCRTLSVSMRNAIKYLKMKITNIPPDMPEEEVMANHPCMYCDVS